MDLKNAKIALLREMFDTIGSIPQTSIALIDGHAYSGGAGLAFARDVRIGSRDSFFQLTEVLLGICSAVISKFVCREKGYIICKGSNADWNTCRRQRAVRKY
jgi:enoyl-CoA hydratase/carnithine racemase